MVYSIQSNRILPSNWKEVRKNKWGFKTHGKCAGGIRACFGTAIKWEVKGKEIYINTSSVKHWWRAHSLWRKENGFGGNFSKKKLIDLLNTKIQGRTTASQIQKASQALPPPVVNSTDLKAEDKMFPASEKKPMEAEDPLTVEGRFKRVCEECRKLLENHRSPQHQNTESFLEELKKLDTPFTELKQWLELSQTEEFKAFAKTSELEKARFVKEILESREFEVYRLKEAQKDKLNALGVSVESEFLTPMMKVLESFSIENNEEFIKEAGLAIPTFKEFDEETEKVMQHRWLILELPKIASTQLDKKVNECKNKLIESFKQGNISDAIDQSDAICRLVEEGTIHDNFKDVGSNLRKLQEELKDKPQILQIDLTQAKKKINQILNEIVLFKHKYQKYITPSFQEKCSESIDNLSKFREDFSLWNDDQESLQEIMANLSKHLPKEILNVDIKAYFANIAECDYQKMLLEMLEECLNDNIDEIIKSLNDQLERITREMNESQQDDEKLQDLDNKLTACSEIMSNDLNCEKKREELKKIFPPHFDQFEEIDPTFDPKIREIIYKDQLRKTCFQIFQNISVDFEKEI